MEEESQVAPNSQAPAPSRGGQIRSLDSLRGGPWGGGMEGRGYRKGSRERRGRTVKKRGRERDKERETHSMSHPHTHTLPLSDIVAPLPVSPTIVVHEQWKADISTGRLLVSARPLILPFFSLNPKNEMHHCDKASVGQCR